HRASGDPAARTDGRRRPRRPRADGRRVRAHLPVHHPPDAAKLRGRTFPGHHRHPDGMRLRRLHLHAASVRHAGGCRFPRPVSALPHPVPAADGGHDGAAEPDRGPSAADGLTAKPHAPDQAVKPGSRRMEPPGRQAASAKAALITAKKQKKQDGSPSCFFRAHHGRRYFTRTVTLADSPKWMMVYEPSFASIRRSSPVMASGTGERISASCMPFADSSSVSRLPSVFTLTGPLLRTRWMRSFMEDVSTSSTVTVSSTPR